jgi:hypothetical protein
LGGRPRRAGGGDGEGPGAEVDATAAADVSSALGATVEGGDDDVEAEPRSEEVEGEEVEAAVCSSADMMRMLQQGTTRRGRHRHFVIVGQIASGSSEERQCGMRCARCDGSGRREQTASRQRQLCLGLTLALKVSAAPLAFHPQSNLSPAQRLTHHGVLYLWLSLRQSAPSAPPPHLIAHITSSPLSHYSLHPCHVLCLYAEISLRPRKHDEWSSVDSCVARCRNMRPISPRCAVSQDQRSLL